MVVLDNVLLHLIMVVVVLVDLVVVMPELVTNPAMHLLVMIPLSLHLKVILEQKIPCLVLTGMEAAVVVLVKQVKIMERLQTVMECLVDLVDMVFNFLQHSRILYHQVL